LGEFGEKKANPLNKDSAQEYTSSKKCDTFHILGDDNGKREQSTYIKTQRGKGLTTTVCEWNAPERGERRMGGGGI